MKNLKLNEQKNSQHVPADSSERVKTIPQGSQCPTYSNQINKNKIFATKSIVSIVGTKIHFEGKGFKI